MYYRMFPIILQTFIIIEKAAQQDHIPHHRKAVVIEDAQIFLLNLQGFDSVIIGTYIYPYTCNTNLRLGPLSCLVLQSLIKLGVKAIPQLVDQCLSPAFYQPDCLSLFSKFVCKDAASGLSKLLSQLNHFEALLLVPEMEQHCLDHIALTHNKSEVVKFAMHRLKSVGISAAIDVLEYFKRDEWPEVYRFVELFL